MQTTHKYLQKKEEALLPQKKKETHGVYLFFLLWEQRESNPRPSACKADALNQLSYAPETGLQIYEQFLFMQILFAHSALKSPFLRLVCTHLL